MAVTMHPTAVSCIRGLKGSLSAGLSATMVMPSPPRVPEELTKRRRVAGGGSRSGACVGRARALVKDEDPSRYILAE